MISSLFIDGIASSSADPKIQRVTTFSEFHTQISSSPHFLMTTKDVRLTFWVEGCCQWPAVDIY